jgi:alpha-glucosidase/alpha-D-xyloside xylohydrolase
MQRYAPFLWSGDVSSLWETLRNHVPIAINTGLSGIPYWGTDIGGFVPTRELTGELYVRWFQFAAFNTLFRSHGRTWKLRLPWGWNTGEAGPVETPNVPLDPKELHNAQVEPICRKYLELRYRMMPYLYSAVREATQTGMPVIRALWLHYPDDTAAVARGDEYLWGRDLLVAPVVEQGAASRKVYLPHGAWHDFWSGERIDGGREITRDVDLATMPLYARAGAIIPMGPVKQYTGENVEGPIEVRVYPGANGSFLLYEDDGRSFDYRKGEWMGIELAWNDARRTLSARLARGSKLLGRRELELKVGDVSKRAVFEGKAIELRAG